MAKQLPFHELKIRVDYKQYTRYISLIERVASPTIITPLLGVPQPFLACHCASYSMQRPLLLTWLDHPSWLHRFTCPPCLTRTLVLLTWLVHPLWWLHILTCTPCSTQTFRHGHRVSPGNIVTQGISRAINIT